MKDVRLLTLDPGHFHAALVQKEMYPGVVRQVHVYAPFGGDLIAHLQRIHGFNTRKTAPTDWEIEVHACQDFLPRLLRERKGNVVVLAGRNRPKIDRIMAALEAGLNVLADKPWIIKAEDQAKLQRALDTADARGLIAFDTMTERHEITSILQRELINDEAIFGTILPGTQQEPGVYMESIHYLSKTVAGVPLHRPPWFFDVDEQGEGLTDVGTHLVDLVMWILFPEQPIDPIREIQILHAKRWPTVMTLADFRNVTGEGAFPGYLTPVLRHDRLEYFCNTQVSYALRGVHVKLDVLWDFEAQAGSGDTHLAMFRGSRSRIEIRQGKAEHYRPELYVVPKESAGVAGALRQKIEQLQTRYSGLGCEAVGDHLWVTIPDRYRVGHEAHFADVMRRFLGYLKNPKSLPKWENPTMRAKYHVTTSGILAANRGLR